MSAPRTEQQRATSSAESRLGETIDGRYRLDEVLGKGGMGVVYRAEHVAIRRTVAVKLLHSQLAGVPELRSRFEREALAIGRIDHPNCVNVTDFGALDDGSLFLVMEHLDGRPLGGLLDKEIHFAPRRALHILRHVLRGLGHAHGSGIVHRDVKPDNVVLVQQDGDEDFAKVLDFGIAKLIAAELDDGVKLTQAGVAFGTPVYMAPEQALGNPVDGRADLYSASVLAYEMLTGRPPFYSDDKLEVLSMHTTRPVPSMAESLAAEKINAVIPARVEELILHGLAKRPHERFATAEEYIAKLDEVLVAMAVDDQLATPPAGTGALPLLTPTGSSVIEPSSSLSLASTNPLLLSRPTSPVSRTLRVIGRHRLAAALTALVVVVGLVVAGVRLRSGDDDLGKPKPGTPAAAAAEKLDHGDPSAAIRALKAAGPSIRSDATAQLHLGHAYAAKRENAPAMEAYRAALLLDERLLAEPQLRANLIAISQDKDVPSKIAALEILVARLDDGDSVRRLIGAAASDDASLRAAAAPLARKLGVGDSVDWLSSYAKDLEQLEACTDRQPIVEKLRALSDPRAIPILEAALKRKGKTGRWANQLVNKCLKDDAEAALTFLRGLPTDPPAAPK